MPSLQYYFWVTFFGFSLNSIAFSLYYFKPKFSQLLKRQPRLTGKFILLAYLVYALLLQGEVQDVALFSSVGSHLRQGIDFYFIDSSHGVYPFFPFLAFYYMLANFIAESLTRVSFSFVVKLLLIPTLFKLSKLIKNSKESISFLLSPVAFAPVVYHGQADILLIYFVVLAILAQTKSTLQSGLYFGLSILSKTWSVILWPLWLSKLKIGQFFYHTLAVLTPICAVVFVYTRIFKSSFTAVLKAILNHPGSLKGFWGISYLKKLVSGSSNFFTNPSVYLLLILMIFHLVAWKKKFSLIKSAKTVLLAFNVFALGWGIQYIVWVLPFAFLDSDYIHANRYSLLAAPYLAFTYLSFSLNPSLQPNLSHTLQALGLLFSLMPWSYSIFWLKSSLKPKAD